MYRSRLVPLAEPSSVPFAAIFLISFILTLNDRAWSLCIQKERRKEKERERETFLVSQFYVESFFL